MLQIHRLLHLAPQPAPQRALEPVVARGVLADDRERVARGDAGDEPVGLYVGRPPDLIRAPPKISPGPRNDGGREIGIEEPGLAPVGDHDGRHARVAVDGRPAPPPEVDGGARLDLRARALLRDGPAHGRRREPQRACEQVPRRHEGVHAGDGVADVGVGGREQVAGQHRAHAEGVQDRDRLVAVAAVFAAQVQEGETRDPAGQHVALADERLDLLFLVAVPAVVLLALLRGGEVVERALVQGSDVRRRHAHHPGLLAAPPEERRPDVGDGEHQGLPRRQAPMRQHVGLLGRGPQRREGVVQDAEERLHVAVAALERRHPGVEQLPPAHGVEQGVRPRERDDGRVGEGHDVQAELRRVRVQVVAQPPGTAPPAEQGREVLGVAEHGRARRRPREPAAGRVAGDVHLVLDVRVGERGPLLVEELRDVVFELAVELRNSFF